MKKIILLSDTEELPEAAFRFAQQLNEANPILLTGVFLPRENMFDASLYYFAGAAAPVLYDTTDDSVAISNEAVVQFRKRCIGNGIDFRIHDECFGDVTAILKKETRFADMLLFSNDAFYRNLDADIYAEYTDDTLNRAECAVIIVPDHFSKPDNIILAYDGGRSSVAAIKQFANLFPEMTSLPTLLVYADEHPQNDFPDKDYIIELVSRHFSDLTIQQLEINPKKYFATWLMNKKNSLLVTGAHNRSNLSMFMRRSFISDIVKDHLLPVFISH